MPFDLNQYLSVLLFDFQEMVKLSVSGNRHVDNKGLTSLQKVDYGEEVIFCFLEVN